MWQRCPVAVFQWETHPADTDNSWRQKACSPKKRLKPGGGSSNRTVARHDCADATRTSWRNHVDVDVVGEVDTAERPMNQAVVNCRVG